MERIVNNIPQKVGIQAVNQGYKYYCQNKKTGVCMWLDMPCSGWKTLKKEKV